MTVLSLPLKSVLFILACARTISFSQAENLRSTAKAQSPIGDGEPSVNDPYKLTQSLVHAGSAFTDDHQLWMIHQDGQDQRSLQTVSINTTQSFLQCANDSLALLAQPIIELDCSGVDTDRLCTHTYNSTEISTHKSNCEALGGRAHIMLDLVDIECTLIADATTPLNVIYEFRNEVFCVANTAVCSDQVDDVCTDWDDVTAGAVQRVLENQPTLSNVMCAPFQTTSTNCNVDTFNVSPPTGPPPTNTPPTPLPPTNPPPTPLPPSNPPPTPLPPTNPPPANPPPTGSSSGGGVSVTQEECLAEFLDRPVWCNPCLTGSGHVQDCLVIRDACEGLCNRPGCGCKFLPANGACVDYPFIYTRSYWACVPEGS